MPGDRLVNGVGVSRDEGASQRLATMVAGTEDRTKASLGKVSLGFFRKFTATAGLESVKRTENREQRSAQRAENREQTTESREQMAENRGQ